MRFFSISPAASQNFSWFPSFPAPSPRLSISQAWVSPSTQRQQCLRERKKRISFLPHMKGCFFFLEFFVCCSEVFWSFKKYGIYNLSGFVHLCGKNASYLKFILNQELFFFALAFKSKHIHILFGSQYLNDLVMCSPFSTLSTFLHLNFSS